MLSHGWLPWRGGMWHPREDSAIVKSIVQHRHALLRWYPDIPLWRFGITIQRQQTDIFTAGVLIHAWQASPAFVTPCLRCGEPAYTTRIAGDARVGLVHGCCPSCGGVVQRETLGLNVIFSELGSCLAGTRYHTVHPSHAPPRESWDDSLRAVLSELDATTSASAAWTFA